MANVLVCDDEPVTIRGLKRFIEREGYTTFTALNAREAMEVMKKREVDILITDVKMPMVDGFTLVEEVKSHYPHIKIIIITGYYCIKDAVYAIKLGASDYITKPISLPDLRASIISLLEEQQLGNWEMENLLPLEEEKFESLIRGLHHPLRRRVVSTLANNGESSFSGIRDSLEIKDPSVLSFHLRNLKLYGLVSQNKKREYHLTEMGFKAANILKSFAQTS